MPIGFGEDFRTAIEPKLCGFGFMSVLQTVPSLVDLKMLLDGLVTPSSDQVD